MRSAGTLTLTVFLFGPALASAQEAGLLVLAKLVPTEFSIGLGGLIDGSPSRSSAAIQIGLSRVWVRDQWLEPAFEFGSGATSPDPLCAGDDAPASCSDQHILFGPRFRPLRQSDRMCRPFVQFLMGAYWTGSPSEAVSPAGALALQAGGGIDLRPARSIHGLRISGDYRRVFAEEIGRHQFQLLAEYFVGWRGPKSGTP